MALIDSHAHLTFPELHGQLEAILERSAEAGVNQIITIGVNLADARAVIALAERYPQTIRAAAGFHPHEADSVTPSGLHAMAELWNDPTIVALGEMGLDYHYDFGDRSKQRSIFARQLAEAAGRPHPLVIHCREALDDVIGLLLEHGFEGRRVVFHCFTGSAREAAKIARHGWRISFTGIVTFPKSTELQAIAKDYSSDQLMIETDAPYLSPVPVRNRRPNEPAHVHHIARFLADLRGMPYDDLVEETAKNTRDFFGL